MMIVSSGALKAPDVEVTLHLTQLDILIDATLRINHSRVVSSDIVSELHLYHKVISLPPATY